MTPLPIKFATFTRKEGRYYVFTEKAANGMVHFLTPQQCSAQVRDACNSGKETVIVTLTYKAGPVSGLWYAS